MRAVRFQGVGRPLTLEEVPPPRPGPGEVAVAVAFCGLCATDLKMYRGRKAPRRALPLILGHEVAGTVAEVGPEVTHIAPGERVVVSLTITCDRCAFCRRGMPELCDRLEVLGIDRDGGLADRVVVPQENVHLLPAGLPLDRAALLPDSVATAYHAVHRSGLGPGDRVAIFGATGGVGSMAAQIATRLHGARVIAVGRSPEKLALAQAQGAWRTVSAREGDAAERILEITGGQGAEVAMECAGQPATTEAALRAVGKGGRLVMVGGLTGPVPLDGPRLMRGELTVIACYLSRRGDLPILMDLAARGTLDLSCQISHRVTLENAMEGLVILEERRGDPIRVLVEVAAS